MASTYARAFADVILKAHLDVERAMAGLRSVAILLNESSDLRQVWENPAIPVEQKRRVLDVIAQRDGISKQVRKPGCNPDRSSANAFSECGHPATGERTRRSHGFRGSRDYQCPRAR